MENLTDTLSKVQSDIDSLELFIVDQIVRFAPWLAPIPTAYLVGRSTVDHLNWPGIVAAVGALAVEVMGVSVNNTTLMLYGYNKSKLKTDPVAPTWLAGSLIGVYVVVAILLTIVLDVSPDIVQYAPAIFPLLSLVGASTIALRIDHKRRLEEVEERKEKRKKDRVPATPRPKKKLALRKGTSNVREQRLEQLVLYCDEQRTAADMMEHLGVSKPTVYSYIRELEGIGKIRKDGVGWEAVGDDF